MSLLNPWVWLGFVAALAAAFGLGYVRGEKSGHAEVLAEWNAERLQQRDAALAAQSENRKLENRRQSLAMEASNAARKREGVLRRAAADTAGELDGLRNDLAVARASRDNVPSGSCKARDDRIAALEDVFEQCAGRYTDLAEKAGRHASDALTFDQAWPPP